MVGQKFGRLTVSNKTEIREEGKSKHRALYYLCFCDCGKNVFIRKQSLKNGNTKSCGCYRRDQCQSIGKQGNHQKQSRQRKNGEIAPLNALLRKYRYNSSKRKIDFCLTKEEFSKLIKENCNYCDIEPTQKLKLGRRTLFYNGVDRIDSSKGYTKENCVTCCKQCNIAKSSYSMTDFISWIERIYKKNIERGR